MFGALNRLISRLDSEPIPQSASQASGDSSYGFQILKNTNPELPLEPWFDFIIGINGHYIVGWRGASDVFLLIEHLQEQPDPSLFTTEIRNCAGGFCTLDLWSAKVWPACSPRCDRSTDHITTGPTNPRPDHPHPTLTAVPWSQSTTCPSCRHAKYLARPHHPFSAVPRPPRRPPPT
jgi:hypothetical protein